MPDFPRFLRNVPWRPVLSCGGATILGVALAPFFLHPAPEPAPQPTETVLDENQTFVVQMATAPEAALLQGRLMGQNLASGSAANAPATVAGTVARHLVEKGALVRAGQPVLEISSGAPARFAPKAEKQQDKAEANQVAAAKQQDVLSERIAQTQAEAQKADARAAAAKARVEQARVVVAKLRRGEEVEAPAQPAPRPERAVSRPASKPDPQAAAQAAAARQEALKNAGVAENELTAAQKSESEARRDLEKAETGARAASEKLKAAQAKAASTAAQGEKGTASDAEVEAARSNAVEAIGAATRATDRAFTARQEVARRAEKSDAAQSKLETARSRVAKTLNSLPIFDAAPPNSEPQNPAPTGHLSVAAAIQEARDALAESEDATREANRLHAEIEGYQKQVAASNTRLESAAVGLQAAQQKVLETTPRPRLTTIVAPADGVVAWIAPLTHEVASGQAVFGLQTSNGPALPQTTFTANFEDKSGLWRSLQPGATLQALVLTSPASPLRPATLGAAPLPGVVASASITTITPPSKPELPVKISAAVTPIGDNEGVVRAGLPLLVSVPRTGGPAALSVPVGAVFKRDGKPFVAVLEPFTAEKSSSGPRFFVEWTRVELGAGNGVQQTIVEGLEANDRVLLKPGELPDAQSAPDGAVELSQTLVRLVQGAPS